MKKITTYIFIFFSFLFISCVDQFNYDNQDKDYTNFTSIVDSLTSPICDKLEDDSIVYITDYVNEKDLKNRSQLGFVLSSQTKVSILKASCSNDIKLQDLQLAKNLRIGQNGSRILTRDINSLKNTNIKDDKQLLAGSYIITNKQILFFLKLINLRTGNIISSSTTSRKISSEIKALEGIKERKKVQKKVMEKDSDIYTPIHL